MVIGAGGAGLMAVAQAQRMGAFAVIVVDIDAAKRESALHAGASRAIDGTAADAVAQIQAATGGGAWTVFNFVDSSQTASLAIAALAKGGTAVVLDLLGGSDVGGERAGDKLGRLGALARRDGKDSAGRKPAL